MKWKLALLLTTFLMVATTFAQPYVMGGQTRHRFAQMMVGLDVRNFPGSNTLTTRTTPTGSISLDKIEPLWEGRLTIGGLHFWGHADFFIAIPFLPNGSDFSTSVETGGRYFPWRIEHKKLRAFVGVSLLPTVYKQKEGAGLFRFKVPLSAGLMYNRGPHLLELTAGYDLQADDRYYINTTQEANITTPAVWLALGYKFMFETTLSAEKRWQTGRAHTLADTLGKVGRLDGFTVSMGPSSAFFLKPSEHNANTVTYLHNHKIANIFPEFGLGYYWHCPDVQINLTFRDIKSEMEAYGLTQESRRTALTMEGFKFLFDYHGFVPFVGLALSYERLKVNETSTSGHLDFGAFTGLKPGLTFGWDIRPDRLQIFYLRTSLRWFPDLSVDMSGGAFRFDQIEFNFIQLVILPERIF